MSVGWIVLWSVVGAVAIWLMFNILMAMAIVGSLPSVFRAIDKTDGHHE